MCMYICEYTYIQELCSSSMLFLRFFLVSFAVYSQPGCSRTCLLGFTSCLLPVQRGWCLPCPEVLGALWGPLWEVHFLGGPSLGGLRVLPLR